MDPFASQLTKNRPALLRTARRRLKNPDWAEDAVSETLLAALEKRPEFVEQSRVRAWLFGILRHKVMDQLRHHLGQDRSLVPLDAMGGDASQVCDPSPRTDPMRRLADRRFLAALSIELQRMPKLHADAFVRRECLDQATAEICHELDITSVYLGVLLHRARHRLRDRLAHHGA